MNRRTALWRASEHARAASDNLILARACEGVAPARYALSLESAIAALEESLALVRASSAPSPFFRAACDITDPTTPDTDPSGSALAVPVSMGAAA